MRIVKRTGTSLMALLAAIALFVGVMRGNARYFYCPFSHVIAVSSCCTMPAPDEDDASPASFAPVDCCQAKRIGSLPAGSVASVPDVPSAPLLALVPSIASHVSVSLARVAQVASIAPNRGPPNLRPTPSRTMVFLI